MQDGLMQRPERVILVAFQRCLRRRFKKWMGGNYKVHWPNFFLPYVRDHFSFYVPITVDGCTGQMPLPSVACDAQKSLEEAGEKAAFKPPVKKARYLSFGDVIVVGH